MGKDKEPRRPEVFSKIKSSFIHGLVRLQHARIGSLSAQVAVRRLRSNRIPPPDDHPLWHVVEPLSRLTSKQLDCFGYVSQVSFLVYATALFDAFLSETTRFLLLANPGALGEDSPLRLEAVLKARSKADVLNLAVGKRVRDLSHQTFRDRLRFLRDRFGLRPNFPKRVTDALDHYSSIRNTVVHEQGFYEAKLNSRGKLTGMATRCPQHPTPVKDDDLHRAVEVYVEAVQGISSAVLIQILKVPPFRAKELLFRE